VRGWRGLDFLSEVISGERAQEEHSAQANHCPASTPDKVSMNETGNPVRFAMTRIGRCD
jgi:hypothetical protein